MQLDKAQFFWLMAYFLGFVSILNLDMKCIKDVLKIDILCYLTWEAQREAEKLEKWFLERTNGEAAGGVGAGLRQALLRPKPLLICAGDTSYISLQ